MTAREDAKKNVRVLRKFYQGRKIFMKRIFFVSIVIGDFKFKR